MFPLIKDRKTCDKQLDWEKVIGGENRSLVPKKKDDKSVCVSRLWILNSRKCFANIAKHEKKEKSNWNESKPKKKCQFVKFKCILQIFVKCKDTCVGAKNSYVASSLKQFTVCPCVMKSNCTKAKWKNDDGQKPIMDLVDYSKHKAQEIPQKCFDID